MKSLIFALTVSMLAPMLNIASANADSTWVSPHQPYGTVTLLPGLNSMQTLNNSSCTPQYGPRSTALHLEASPFSAGAMIDYVSVTFGDGQVQQLQVRRTIAPGTETFDKAFDGGARCVKELHVYGTGLGGYSNIIVEGR